MLKLTTTEAREIFAELVNRAAFGNERIVVTRHGKDVAVLISMEELARLQALDVEEPAREKGRRTSLPPSERAEASAKGRSALKALREHAKAKGHDRLTENEIEDEVAATRKARKRG